MSHYKEQTPHLELSPNLVNGFIEIFIHRTDCYPLQRPNGAYVCIKEAISPQLIQAHLRGLVTMGAYALDAQSHTHWVCLDADDDLSWDTLRTTNSELAKEGIASYLETSRRGGHLWLFTDPLLGQVVRQFAQVLVQQYSIPDIEIYPKQNILTTGVGSLVRLPFGIHQKTGKRYPFVTPEGQPLASRLYEQIELLAFPTRVPTVYIQQLNTIFAYELKTEAPLTISMPTSRKDLTTRATLSERLKDTISVYDFVNRYVSLDARGKGLCPFHDDHLKSFQVHVQRNFWHCYAGCGGGSLIDFWMKWRDTHGQDGSFTSTIKDLREILL